MLNAEQPLVGGRFLREASKSAIESDSSTKKTCSKPPVAARGGQGYTSHHPSLPPDTAQGTEVSWHWDNTSLWCCVSVSAHYKTGIEMEALTGVAAGLLCAFDMVKSLEKDEEGQYPVARASPTLKSLRNSRDCEPLY